LLDAIRSTTVEVGTKQILQLGDNGSLGSLMYDIAAYWLRVTNDIIPYRNGRFYFTAGRTERMGLELGGTLNLAMGLSANVALTISSNKYKEYVVDSVHYGKPGALANYADNKVVGIPDVYYTLGVKYRAKEWYGAYIGLTLQNVGKYFANDANTITVPAYTILNASAGIDRLLFANGRMYLTAYVAINNLTDKKYIGSAWLNPDVVEGSARYIEPGLPRTVVGGVGIGVNL
jgi:iron complex outermembrane receptor protein